MPDLFDDVDLDIVVRRNHTPCGMHVDSGTYVEITHKPTGVVVAVHTGRSAVADRDAAIIALRAVLDA